MTESPILSIATKDAELDEETRASIERRCESLKAEFPETTHYEVTIALDGTGHVAHARVTGKNTDVAGHGNGDEPRHATDRLFDSLERQLRKGHDKRIFQRRREARRHPPKKEA